MVEAFSTITTNFLGAVRLAGREKTVCKKKGCAAERKKRNETAR